MESEETAPMPPSDVAAAEIKMASEDLMKFVQWCANVEIVEEEEFQTIAELVYSYARAKNSEGAE